MSDTKRALVEIIRANPNAEPGDLIGAILDRIAEADDAAIVAMAKIRCCGIEGCCYQDHRRSELCGAMNAYGGEARAALAAAMRQIANGGNGK